jgi:hypothetical protein
MDDNFYVALAVIIVIIGVIVTVISLAYCLTPDGYSMIESLTCKPEINRRIRDRYLAQKRLQKGNFFSDHL